MSSSSPLEDWLAALVATRGLTALRDPAEARRVLLDDSLAGADLVARFDGTIVDVGSGGGAPGIPLAYSFPDREVVLLEAEHRKCDFLEIGRPGERAGRLGTRRGAGDRLGRSRRREGPRPAPDCGRMVPAARAGRRSCRALARPLRRPGSARGCGRTGRGVDRGFPCRLCGDPKDRADPARFSPPHGPGQEAAARLVREPARRGEAFAQAGFGIRLGR